MRAVRDSEYKKSPLFLFSAILHTKKLKMKLTVAAIASMVLIATASAAPHFSYPSSGAPSYPSGGAPSYPSGGGSPPSSSPPPPSPSPPPPPASYPSGR